MEQPLGPDNMDKKKHCGERGKCGIHHHNRRCHREFYFREPWPIQWKYNFNITEQVSYVESMPAAKSEKWCLIY